jgi:hypothetical protein
MAWTKAKTTGVLAVVIFVMLAFCGLIVFRHKISDHFKLAAGERKIKNHVAVPVDMTVNYTTPASYFPKITSFPAWKSVPVGFQVFDNVPLQIDGMICLWGSGNAKMGIVFPEQISGIVVNQKFETLYVYHGSFFKSPPGTPVCGLIFHYEDGSSATNELLYGNDILDWIESPTGKMNGPTGPNSKLAWVGGTFKPGTKRPLRFCLTAIQNPQPSLAVESIDLYSCKSATAACIMAMTPGMNEIFLLSDRRKMRPMFP